MPQFLRHFAKWFQPALFCALLLMGAGNLGAPLWSIAESRGSESEENAPVNERAEDCTVVSREDHVRAIKLQQRRLVTNIEVPASLHLGHTQNDVLSAPSGHRLANGLLAPITC